MTDAELVQRALAGGVGSQDAYAELLARYERPMYTLILRMVRDRTLAEDLAQDAFIKAFAKLGTFEPERKLSSWLFKIAHNTAIDHLRRRDLETVSLDEPAGDDPDAAPRTVVDRTGETPAAAAERSDLSRAMTRAVARLRPEYRQVIVLRYQAGLEYAEIAEESGLPLGTVKTYIHRARKELSGLLQEAGWTPEGALGG